MHTNQSGNVLFLILIAVMLFAALSFAIMGSTRSGDGTSGSEGNLIGSAQITQYPALISSTLLRMAMNGTEITAFEFNPPSDFAALTTNRDAVFHPEGIGATYENASPKFMAGDQQGKWYYNAHFEVENMGTSIAGSFEGNEIIAFLPGISQLVCEKLNEELGIPGVPVASSADYYNNVLEYMDNTYILPAGETIIGTSGLPGLAELDGQAFGCYRESSSNAYIYYHVLLER